MTTSNPAEFPQIDIGLDGHLSLIGECKGIATVRLEGVAFADTELATRKLAGLWDRHLFQGQCIATKTYGSQEPVFIFTVIAGEALRNPEWFLRMLRKRIDPLVPEIELLSRTSR